MPAALRWHDSGVRGVTIDHQESPTREESVELYTAVGWSAYTRDPDALMRAVRGSRHLVTARCDGELIGLARIVGDGVTIVYRSRPNHFLVEMIWAKALPFCSSHFVVEMSRAVGQGNNHKAVRVIMAAGHPRHKHQKVVSARLLGVTDVTDGGDTRGGTDLDGRLREALINARSRWLSLSKPLAREVSTSSTNEGSALP